MHLVKGMKVWFRSKTMKPVILTIPVLVLTMFYGFTQDLAAQAPYRIKKIVIDAGHGGKDPGCHGNNSKEKDVALAIALGLGEKIKSNFPDIKVIYTRDTDVFIPLNERAAIANRNQADLFISIHCNYIGVRNRATGTETYVLGLYRAEDNLDVAKRENAAILLEDDYEKTYNGFDPYSTEGHIILSMFQNAHLEQSINFATHVQGAVKNYSDLSSRGVKQAGFLVLRETTMPSVLIETGFLSTDVDENYLIKKENQDEMSLCIFKAFSQYKKEVEDTEVDTEIAGGDQVDSIKTDSTKPVNAITVAQKSEGIIYRIQIAASSKSVIDSRYQAMEDLEIIKENDLYKFLVGRFTTPEAARPRLSALKASGFNGAFIVAYKEGQRIRA
jgi:N-acetylmuramoyl-L-alanine amidase